MNNPDYTKETQSYNNNIKTSHRNVFYQRETSSRPITAPNEFVNVENPGLGSSGEFRNIGRGLYGCLCQANFKISALNQQIHIVSYKN